MALFTQRKPRRFRYDRKYGGCQVSQNDNNINNESLSHSTNDKVSNIGLKQGVFSSATRYLSRHQEKRRSGGLYMSTALCLLFIVLLVVVWNLLMTK